MDGPTMTEPKSKKRRKRVTPLDRSVPGYVAPEAAEQPPIEADLSDRDSGDGRDLSRIRRARAWCRRRHDEQVWARAVWLSALASFGVAEQAARHVAMWVECGYMAAEQGARVHRCPPESKCALCQQAGYRTQDEIVGGPQPTPRPLAAVLDEMQDRNVGPPAKDLPTESFITLEVELYQMCGLAGLDLTDDEMIYVFNKIDGAMMAYAMCTGETPMPFEAAANAQNLYLAAKG